MTEDTRRLLEDAAAGLSGGTLAAFARVSFTKARELVDDGRPAEGAIYHALACLLYDEQHARTTARRREVDQLNTAYGSGQAWLVEDNDQDPGDG